MTLLRIGGSQVTQANTLSEKREMLRGIGPDDTLIALWTGRWRTDAFTVPDELFRRWREELG